MFARVRKKLFGERITLPLATDMPGRIDACLEPGEARLSFLRDAIEKELRRRGESMGVRNTEVDHELDTIVGPSVTLDSLGCGSPAVETASEIKVPNATTRAAMEEARRIRARRSEPV
jgi:hypothetical protein